MNKIGLLIFLLGFLFLTSLESIVSFPQMTPPDRELVRQIETYLSKWNGDTIPGFSIAVIKDGELVFKRGYGMADLKRGIPNTAETVYNIGSVSKQFTAMCILLLEEEGKLSLRNPLTRFFPDFPQYADGITLYHLMHQTSGLSDYLNLLILSGEEPFKKGITEQGIWQVLNSQNELIFEPGTRFQYSNSNYFLLARIVEKVSGMSINEYARENIFLPLGMNSTFFGDQSTDAVESPEIARAYGTDEKGEFKEEVLILNEKVNGSGGIYSTVEDLALWEQNFYDNKLGKKSQGLIEKLHDRGVLNDGKEINYAGGLFVGSFRGTTSITHQGQSGSYSSNFASYPDKKSAVIILKNNLIENVDVLTIVNAVLFGEWSQDASSSPTIEDLMKKVKTAKYDYSVRELEGQYPIRPGSFLDISYRDDRLVAQRPIGSEPLLPAGSDDNIFLGIYSGVNYKFEQSKEGQPVKLVQQFPQMSMPAISKLATNGISVEEMREYDGKYYNPELDVNCSIKTGGPGKLLVTMNGSTPSTLFATGRDQFGGDGMVLKFERKGNLVSDFSLRNHRIKTLHYERKTDS